jgi:hypothetical protein
VNSLASPYGHCVDKSSGLDPYFYQAFDRKGKKYRQKNCLDIMIQKYAAKMCDCIFNGLVTENNGEKYCQLNETFQCITKLLNQTNSDQFINNCPLECNQTDYDISISTSSSSQLDYLKSYEELNNEGDSFSLNYSSVKSIFSIYIYFNELGYTQIVEVPNYTPISLISNIGGTLGLFLGMSLLSFIEIVDLVIQMILTSTRSNSNQVENY